MHKIDVAIAGGGPGGLAAANSILKVNPRLRVRVFEKARQLHPVGFTVAIQRNGFSALEAIDPACIQKVESCCIADGPVARYNAQLEEVFRVPSVLKALGGETGKTAFIPWHRLQSALMELLPEETVQLDSHLERMVPSPDGVTLSFDGQPDVLASIVVGCDGNQSAVRRLWLDDGPPTFMNNAVWRGQTDTPIDWPHTDNCSTWFRLARNITMHVVRLGEGRLAWFASAPWKPEDLPLLLSSKYVDGTATATSDGDKIDRCLNTLGDAAPPYLKDLVRSTHPTSITEHGMFYRDPEACTTWGRGPVTLLGDAAHLATAALGQGTNMALEDGVELGRAIGKLGPTEAALREYEAVRIPRANKVQAASVQMALDMIAGKARSGSPEPDWYRDNPWCMAHEVAPLVPAVVGAGAGS